MKEVNVLSFGAGVQSTTLALMSQNQAHGVPMFDFAVFADTGAEPDNVYQCLERIRESVDYPIITHMQKGGLLNGILENEKSKHRFGCIPAFVENQSGEVGMLRRQCTKEYKLDAIVAAIRKQLGYQPRQKVTHKVNMFIGISRDEMQRMNTPLTPWMTNNYPLVDMAWRRNHCVDYLKDNWPHPVGKSACTFCPYHDNKTWREMKRNDPASWAQAVEVDEKIRGGFRGSLAPLYLHRSMQPLKDVDFDAILARNDDQREFGFLDECDGIYGL